MLKKFVEYLNENRALDDLVTREDFYLNSVWGERPDARIVLNQGFNAMILALTDGDFGLDREELELLNYLVSTGLMSDDELPRTAISRVPGVDSPIVCLTEHTKGVDSPQLVGHPDLAGGDWIAFGRLLDAVPDSNWSLIWESDIWQEPNLGEPVVMILYFLPAEDGGSVKLVTLDSSSLEAPEVFMLRKDLRRRLKKGIKNYETKKL